MEPQSRFKRVISLYFLLFNFRTLKFDVDVSYHFECLHIKIFCIKIGKELQIIFAKEIQKKNSKNIFSRINDN